MVSKVLSNFNDAMNLCVWKIKRSGSGHSVRAGFLKDRWKAMQGKAKYAVQTLFLFCVFQRRLFRAGRFKCRQSWLLKVSKMKTWCYHQRCSIFCCSCEDFLTSLWKLITFVALYCGPWLNGICESLQRPPDCKGFQKFSVILFPTSLCLGVKYLIIRTAEYIYLKKESEALNGRGVTHPTNWT